MLVPLTELTTPNATRTIYVNPRHVVAIEPVQSYDDRCVVMTLGRADYYLISGGTGSVAQTLNQAEFDAAVEVAEHVANMRDKR